MSFSPTISRIRRVTKGEGRVCPLTHLCTVTHETPISRASRGWSGSTLRQTAAGKLSITR